MTGAAGPPRVPRGGPAIQFGFEPCGWKPMRNINWKLIAFISVMWWLIYSAPTEDSITTWLFGHGSSRATSYDDF